MNQPQKPNNYLVLAIICTVCCCLPAGIVGIVYSSKVNETYANGDYEAAEKASKNAKLWSIIGLSTGVIVLILYFLIFGFAVFASAMENGGF
ncbi:CD225/dispanin family protein [Costertonia aggregata]|uniref:CD225/dispanin family protein n=1 Tax=Costertonia aggregata TaxID=343403 RepID=A0A7H9ASA5_9FLAO|nr:CD225/dispanin family protein [Costertonia aggregata]QLG46381.1 CD225/dispanin family protein [Costertonia aggregata]